MLGDSFSNIYSFEPMGWGESAGFVEQVGYYLGRPIDRMIRNDGGAFATREMLRRDLARGEDRLAGKRVVVWQFVARELAVGDWRPIPLVLHAPRPSQFFVPGHGDVVTVTGRIQEVSSVPRPGTVPYRDHILSLHLVDLPEGAEAIVYLQSMVDNRWTSAARLRGGQDVTLELQAWQAVADQLPASNASQEPPGIQLQSFYEVLRAEGVEVLDLAEIMMERRGGDHGAPYCRTDTHWSGVGCVVAAEAIAHRISDLLDDGDRQAFATEWRQIKINGDLLRMLDSSVPPAEDLSVRAVQGDTVCAQSPVLVLGDSHTLVFHSGGDMHYRGAGLVDQLACELGLPVDLIGVRGSGATPARINLFRRVRQDPGFWERKRVVV